MKEGNMGSYYMYWYKQTHDKLLKFVNREGKSYGEGFKERFASELSSSNNKFALLISSTILADSGVYYCAASYTLTDLFS
ncbi:HV459 protein, partial [Polypterus senegalus]